MEIRTFDYQLLSALESDPLMSFSDLSKRLGTSWPTIKKRYNELKDNNILFVPRADYHPERLGLQRINIFVKVPDIKSLEIVEHSCREHPYTVYRARWITDTFGLLLQYNIPLGSLTNLNLFFDKLVKDKIVSSYQIYSSNGGRIQLTSDLEKYDLINEKWDFNWNDWLDNNSEVSSNLNANGMEPIVSNFKEFKKIHFDILRDLTHDASIKQADLMKLYNLSRTDASRHYNYVINNFVNKIRVKYDFSIINMYNVHMILIENLSKDEINRLKYNFINNPPPFRSSFDICDNNVLIWSRMNRPQSVDFTYSFWKKFPDMKYFFLSSLLDGAAGYQFYPSNFDFDKQDWRRSEEYMVDEPYERLQEYIEKMNN